MSSMQIKEKTGQKFASYYRKCNIRDQVDDQGIGIFRSVYTKLG